MLKTGAHRKLLLWIVGLLAVPLLPFPYVHAQSDSQTFAGTGKTVRGKFLAKYWSASGGGVLQYGLPISEEMQERSDTDGKTYTTQYFERAAFELHPQNQPPYDVLFSLLGVFEYKQKYPTGAPGQIPNNSAGSRLFPETGKRVGCEFLDYWLRSGGLMEFGYPISEEFTEVSDLDSRSYKVQYFQRAVFSYHGEGQQGQTVQRSDLGTFLLSARYPSLAPSPTPQSTAKECAPTAHGGTVTSPEPGAPLRSSVGQGHVMKGVVKSSRDCAPISEARVVFWLAAPDGNYDDAHSGAVLTDGSGAYTFESNFPGLYGGRPIPHIHMFASAEGYRSIEAEYFPSCGETEGTFDLVLEAR